MKLFAILFASAFADNSIINGVEQQLCNGEMCGTAHGRYAGSQVCMRVDETVIAYYGASAGNIGDEKCSCIFAHRWHMSQGRSWPVVASKTPECAYAYLTASELNLVDEGFENVVLANAENTDNRCSDATQTKNGH